MAEQLDKADTQMVLSDTFRPAIELAIASYDQVRAVAGLNGVARLSFDQTAVEATARMRGIVVTPQVSQDLFILQQEGLRIMRAAS